MGVEPTADNALSRSPRTSISIARSSTFNACAAVVMALIVLSFRGLPRCNSTPARVIAGARLARISNRLAASSIRKKVCPVMLPPGWDMLAARPMVIRSGPTIITVGIFAVAR
jgi:hypothetical protein